MTFLDMSIPLTLAFGSSFIKILDNYCKDFKGRKITYERICDDTVKMLVNDAMEFLYTLFLLYP